MYKFLFILSFSLIFKIPLIAQEYFQQEVNYSIEVSLNDTLHELNAFERIEYINHSKTTLTFIYIHLWPNAYKNNKTALALQLLEQGNTTLYDAPPADLGFIDGLNFKVDGKVVNCLFDSLHPDICKLQLASPLEAEGKIEITTPFRVKLPSGKISRLGHLGQAYTISQWYPKPAVFDNAGWHAMPYLNQGEFYSEFGGFDVKITLPENYVVGATGDFPEGDPEIEWMNKKAEETEKKIAQIQLNPAGFKPNLQYPASSIRTKTLCFRQANVHDFAWFCDKRYNVLKGELYLPNSKRKVNTWALFTDARINLWKDAIAYLNDATFFYSLWNGDYQYKHVTAVDGTISAGGGMEYPNVTVIGDESTALSLETTIMHEVGHNWFYGMLGSNERDHAWMDEGINSFNELRYLQTKYPGQRLNSALGMDSTKKTLGLHRFMGKARYELFYKFRAGQNLDQPLSLHAADFEDVNYGAVVYYKTAILFYYLMHYMGEENFDKAMQFYFDKWKFKHPQPKDLREILEYFSEKKLSWFFDDFISTTKKIDYKIQKILKAPDGSYEVWVENKGEVAGPLPLCGLSKNKIKGMVWYDGFTGTKQLFFPPAEIDAFRIDYFEVMPETNRQNNSMRITGSFKKTEPLRLSFIGNPDYPYNTNLFFAPLLGLNAYEHIMPGLAIYNHLVFTKPLEFELLPFYSINSGNLYGYAHIQGNILPKTGIFQRISPGIGSARFGYNDNPEVLTFQKLSPSVKLLFRKKNAKSPAKSSITLRSVIVSKEVISYQETSSGAYERKKIIDQTNIQDITFFHENKRVINPFSFLVNAQIGNGMSKLALQYIYHITIKKKKYVELRFFAGKMFSRNSKYDYRFRMSGQTGSQDYLYDEVYMARNKHITSTLGSQQFTETDGAFKIFTDLGYSDDWIGAINLKSPKLFKLPLLFYADAGIYTAHYQSISSTGQVTKGISSPEVLYSGGIGIPLIRGIAEIYVPLFHSKNIKESYSYAPDFVDRIRFVFNLSKLNPLKMIKEESLF